MSLARTCSECGSPLLNRSVAAKTCSDNCRSTRSRRLRRIEREQRELHEDHGQAVAEVAAMVRREAPDYAKNVLQDELRPIIRQALTEDVLRAVDRLVGLTPAAVAAIEEDLLSDDKTIRQRAYTLLVKYTVGHPALVKHEDTADNSQLVVNFNLPRPGAPDPDVVEPEQDEATRTCDMCSTDYPESEFVVGSDRCQSCFDEWRKTILKEFK